MDQETTEEIRRHLSVFGEGLRAEIQTVRTEVLSLRTEVSDLRTEVQTDVSNLRTEVSTVRTEVANLRTQVSTDLQTVRTEIQTARRHFDVVGEGLRSEIRIVAEGLEGFREVTAAEFKAVGEEIAETQTMIRLSFGELDRRIRS